MPKKTKEDVFFFFVIFFHSFLLDMAAVASTFQFKAEASMQAKRTWHMDDQRFDLHLLPDP